MIKRFSAIFLLLMLGFNYAVFAEDNWQFTESANSTQYSTINPYESGNIYTPYVSSPDNIYVDNENNDYSYSGHVYTNTQNQANVSKKKDGTFSENHPVITGIGVGALVVGVLALGWLLSDNDNDDDKDYHRHNEHDKAFSHNDNHGHHQPPPPKHHSHQHDYSHNYR